MADSNQFHAGKDARRRGLPREIPDCRLSSAARLDWYAGWDYQNEAMRPAPTAEQRQAHTAFCDDLIARLGKIESPR